MTQVFCTFQIEGMHRWPNAPDDVKFLRAFHRHMFHFRVACRVAHGDRDVEFITLRQQCIHLIRMKYPPMYVMDGPRNFDTLSCEHIGTSVLEMLKEKGFSPVSAEVSEDGENGAVCSLGDI